VTRKTCNDCGVTKPPSEYHKCKRAKDGRRGRCKVCRQIESRLDREKHYETRIKPYQKSWADDNKERMLSTHKEWRDKNRNKIRSYWRNSIKSGVHRAVQSRRRAKIKGASINDFTTGDWNDLQIEHDYRCAYCGDQPERLERDHVIPLSRGGNHTKSNIVPSCRSCNAVKNDRLLGEIGLCLIKPTP